MDLKEKTKSTAHFCNMSQGGQLGYFYISKKARLIYTSLSFKKDKRLLVAYLTKSCTQIIKSKILGLKF